MAEQAGQPSPQAQASALVNTLSAPPAGTPPAAPQLPEGFKAEEFNKQLKAVTGFESYDQIPKIRADYDALKGEYDKLTGQFGQTKARMSELEAKSQIKPFANPFVEKVNELFSNGRSQGEINKFLFLHSQDIDGMDFGKAVQLKMQLENPSFDEDDIHHRMEEQFGAIPDEGDENYDKIAGKVMAKLKAEGKQAKDWLKSQMASFDDPQAAKSREEINTRQTAYREAWSQVAGAVAIPKNPDELKLAYQMQDDKIGGEYKFEYTPKLTDDQGKQIAKMVADFAVQNNMPLDETSLPALRDYRQAIIRTMFHEEFTKHMLMDAFASFQQYFVQRYSAPGAMQRGSQPPTHAAPAQKPPYKPVNGFL